MPETSNTSRIVRFHETGDASVLKMDDIENTSPAPNEVIISVEAFGLNRAEVMFRKGEYLEDPHFPSRLGSEASGTVEAVGKKVSHVQKGDRVSTIPSFSMGKYGVYGERATVPAHAVVKYPESLSAVEGTSIWMSFLTAYGALVEIGDLSSADTVIITAASGSVGLAALQIAKREGATAIATTRTPAKKENLLQAGADHVIVTSEENLRHRVDEITRDGGLQLVFDPIAGAFVEDLAEAAAPGATLIEYGALSGEPTPFPLISALNKGLTVRGYTLFEITQDENRRRTGVKYVTSGFESGDFYAVIDKTFSFENVADAHRYMESNEQMGKIVVTVDEN